MLPTTVDAGSAGVEDVSTRSTRLRTYGRRHLLAVSAAALGVAVASMVGACGDDFKFEPKSCGVFGAECERHGPIYAGKDGKAGKG